MLLATRKQSFIRLVNFVPGVLVLLRNKSTVSTTTRRINDNRLRVKQTLVTLTPFRTLTNKKRALASAKALSLKVAMTYSPTNLRSTIGAPDGDTATDKVTVTFSAPKALVPCVV